MRGYLFLRRWMVPFFFLFAFLLGVLVCTMSPRTLPQLVWPTPTVLPTRN